MPISFPPFGGYNDPDVKRAFNWMVSFLNDSDWRRRSEQIEAQLEASHIPHATCEAAIDFDPISVSDDRAAWYLYLVDAVLHAPLKYEPTQGARVVPIFKRLGADLDLLQSIHGIDDRVKRMLTSERQQPDGVLFELLVSLIWRRNGAKDVEFLEESPPNKRPDIRASMGKDVWYIECKRLDKSSVYSENERRKWLQMWSLARDILIDARYSIVLDIIFHVELETLPDDFLVTELCGKLALVQAPCTVISNDIWEVAIAPVDYTAAKTHLAKYKVKYPSDQIVELVGGHREPNRGFTAAIEGQFVRIGEGPGNNRFLDELSYAIGAFWSCDAERSIERKARDIRKRLAEAVRQLPEATPGVVHIGLETLDGQIVELERYRRIVNSVQQFDSKNKDLRWIYCHLFQSYAPPHDCWIIDETVYYFSRSDQSGLEPITMRSAIITKDEISYDASDVSVHWLRTPP